MESKYNLKNYIQGVITGANNTTGTISYVKQNDSTIKTCESEQLTKCIASFFDILDDYPNLQSISMDEKLYNLILYDLEEYKNKNYVNIKLTDELKNELDKCNKEELYKEYNKYFQNLLTNKEVLKYIKELIDKKDYYLYEKYVNYTKEQCVEEIKVLKHIFKVLENVEFRENQIGIKEKYISFEPGSYEYENITPFICFDIYDIKFYKKVLDLLEKKLKVL